MPCPQPCLFAAALLQEFAIRLMQAQADEEWNRHELGFWQSLGPDMSVSNITYAMALVRHGELERLQAPSLCPPVLCLCPSTGKLAGSTCCWHPSGPGSGSYMAIIALFVCLCMCGRLLP